MPPSQKNTGIINQILQTLNRFGIHPLAAIIALLLLVFMPRFLILILIAFGVYWYASNVGFGNKRQSGSGRGQGKGRRRR